MTDFWLSSGHLLLDHDESGYLIAGDEFLKLYFARPEVVPPDEACEAERALHGLLLADPRRPVSAAEIAALADADARENWHLLISFRDHLLAHPSLEAAYLALMRKGVGRTPPLFITQLVHVILRNALDGESDPFVLRAAEVMFRPQRLTREQGCLLLADDEVVEGARTELHASPLVAMLGAQADPFARLRPDARNLDVLSEANAADYFKRSDAYDLVLDFRPGGAGRNALARVIERWLAHMLRLDASVTPLERIEDHDWFWFVGLDQEGTRIGNALWRGKEPDPGAMERVVGLYGLQIGNVPSLQGRLIYLILAMTRDQIVRMKPQNLLVGLPPAATGDVDGRA